MLNKRICLFCFSLNLESSKKKKREKPLRYYTVISFVQKKNKNKKYNQKLIKIKYISDEMLAFVSSFKKCTPCDCFHFFSEKVKRLLKRRTNLKWNIKFTICIKINWKTNLKQQ